MTVLSEKEVPVWDPLVRGFHWSLVLFFCLSYLTAGEQILNGPGLSQADCQLLSQRGVSRDEAGSEHHGLGLHICRAVVDSYSGQLVMQTSALGGLQIRMTLPNQG